MMSVYMKSAKKQWVKSDIGIILFEEEDVIKTSGEGGEDGEITLPYQPRK